MVGGNLGGFLVLAVVNSTSVNFVVHVSFRIIVSSIYMPRVGLLDHMVVLFLVFKGAYAMFSAVVVPIYIPTNSLGGFSVLHTLSSVCCL